MLLTSCILCNCSINYTITIRPDTTVCLIASARLLQFRFGMININTIVKLICLCFSDQHYLSRGPLTNNRYVNVHILSYILKATHYSVSAGVVYFRVVSIE